MKLLEILFDGVSWEFGSDLIQALIWLFVVMELIFSAIDRRDKKRRERRAAKRDGIPEGA